jgi:hypothetical protein
MATLRAFQKGGDMPAKFPLGRILATPGACEALQAAEQDPLHFLSLHASGAWGDLSREDREANERAVAYESDPRRRDRVFSSYRTRLDTKIWLITERDRSVTTMLLPEEY